MQNSKTGRQTNSRTAVKATGSVLMSTILLASLFLVPAEKANAQVECMGKCEEQLANCLANGGQEFGGVVCSTIGLVSTRAWVALRPGCSDRQLTAKTTTSSAEIGGPADELPA